MNLKDIKSQISFNNCDIYTLLWIAYGLQNILYERGSLLSQSFLAFLMIMGLICFYQVNFNMRNKPVFFVGLNVLLIMFIIYGIYGIMFLDPIRFGYHTTKITNPADYLKNVLISILPIYAYYYYSVTGQVKLVWLKIVFILLLALSIAQFFDNEKMILSEARIDLEGITNNVAYVMLGLIPMLAFWNDKKLLQFSFMLVITYFIISGFKRGAIVVAAFCLIFFLYNVFRTGSKKEKFIIVLLFVTAVIIGYYFITNMLETNLYFNERLEQTIEGYSSDRDIIYSKLIYHLQHEDDFINLLFGHGPNYTVVVAREYAHQDWLELAVDTGIFGVIAYAMFFMLMLKSIFRLPKKSIYFQAAVLCFVIIFTKTLFSMSYNDINIATSLTLGVSMAKIKVYDNKPYIVED